MTPQELKFSILHLAFTGKLVPQINSENTNDTPCSSYSEIPFDIPDSWTWNEIGNCCQMYTGNSISESEKKAKYEGLKDGYDYIATKDVSFEHVISYENGVKIPYSSDFRVAYKDAILMCIEGGSAGRKIAILDRDVCFGNKLCMFKAESVLNTYLYYYLQSSEFKKEFKDNITGIIGGVSIKKLKSILLPVPSLSEQKRIVSKIEELLTLIKCYENAWTKLEDFNRRFPEDLRKSILQLAIQGKLVTQDPADGTGEELYKQIQEEKNKLIKAGIIKKEKTLPKIEEKEVPYAIPETWKWVRLTEILLQQPVNGFSPKGVGYVTPFRNLTLTATTSGYFNQKAFKYVDIPKDVAEKYYIKKDDILIQRSNSRDYVGTSCIYNLPSDQFIYPDLMMRCHLLPNICVKYIDFVLKAPLTRSYFQQKASGTSDSMPKISQSIVRETIIPLPPLAEQKRIVAILEDLLPLCDKLLSNKG